MVYSSKERKQKQTKNNTMCIASVGLIIGTQKRVVFVDF